MKIVAVCVIHAQEIQEGPEPSKPPLASYGLPELLKLSQANKNLQDYLSAAHREAKERLNQVSAEKWLSTFELKAFTGVVPDVDAEAAVKNQNANAFLFNINSSDLENDFSFSRLGPFGRVEVKLVQPLYTWGKISSYSKMAKNNRELVAAQMDAAVDEVRYLVKRAYYTLLLSIESLAILTEVKTKLAQAEEKLEELLIKNSDNVEENDRLKIRVFMADVENRTLDASRGERLARSALYELTGLSEGWQLDQTNLSPEVVQSLAKDEILKIALKSQPEVRQLDELIQIKIAEKGAIKADLLPTIFLAGQVDYAIAPGRTDIKNPYLNDPFNEFNVGVALGLKQDLGLHRTLNKMDQIQAEIEKLQAQKGRLASLTKIRAEEAFERAVSAMQAIQVNERGFRAARSWLTSTGLAFNLGTAPTKDVLESYAAYFKARVDLLKSIYELNMALAELSKASGREVVDRLKDGALGG